MSSGPLRDQNIDLPQLRDDLFRLYRFPAITVQRHTSSRIRPFARTMSASKPQLGGTSQSGDVDRGSSSGIS